MKCGVPDRDPIHISKHTHNTTPLKKFFNIQNLGINGNLLMKYNCTICIGTGYTSLGKCPYCGGIGLSIAKIKTPAVNKLKVVYISGPMRYKEQEYYDMFNIAKKKLKDLGYDPRSPLDLGKLIDDYNDDQYYEILGKALNMMLECRVIMMLPKWEDSNGAKIERGLAIARGMEVLYWEDLCND